MEGDPLVPRQRPRLLVGAGDVPTQVAGDAAKLDKVAKLAVADHALNSQGQYALAAALQKLGRVTETQAIEAQAKANSRTGR